MPKRHVQLTPKARRYKRALGLLEIDRGKTHTPKLQDPRHDWADPECLGKEIPHTRLGLPERCLYLGRVVSLVLLNGLSPVVPRSGNK